MKLNVQKLKLGYIAELLYDEILTFRVRIILWCKFAHGISQDAVDTKELNPSNVTCILHLASNAHLTSIAKYGVPLQGCKGQETRGIPLLLGALLHENGVLPIIEQT